jgi:hypothetical protein
MGHGGARSMHCIVTLYGYTAWRHLGVGVVVQNSRRVALLARHLI